MTHDREKAPRAAPQPSVRQVIEERIAAGIVQDETALVRVRSVLRKEIVDVSVVTRSK
jgi:hypothetical protein